VLCERLNVLLCWVSSDETCISIASGDKNDSLDADARATSVHVFDMSYQKPVEVDLSDIEDIVVENTTGYSLCLEVVKQNNILIIRIHPPMMTKDVPS